MPLYEYHCPACGHEFEVLQRMSEGNANVKCPQCATSKPEKKFSTFAAQMAGGAPSPAMTGGGGCSHGACGCGASHN